MTLEIFCSVWVFKKKVHNILLYDAGQFYVKKQDGGRIKICETFSGNSLKEDLSIDTTFDPCYSLWDSPFNKVSQLKKLIDLWDLKLNQNVTGKQDLYNVVEQFNLRGL